jgi:hypothetical protein
LIVTKYFVYSERAISWEDCFLPYCFLICDGAQNKEYLISKELLTMEGEHVVRARQRAATRPSPQAERSRVQNEDER